MKKFITNKKNLAIIIGCLLALAICVSISYAYYLAAVSQQGENVVKTDCFKITFIDQDEISLDNSFPITDAEGETLTPYQFTIRNVCEYSQKYEVNLETLSTSTIDESKIKVKFDNNNPFLYGNNGYASNKVITSAKNAIKLAEGTLNKNEEQTYNLRLWLDENVTLDTPNIQNKSYKGKVTVYAEQNIESHDVTIAYIVDGQRQDVPPAKTDGYLVSSVECTNGNGSWDNSGWGLYVNNMTGKVTCDITFEEAQYNNVTKWLATANINESYTTLNEVFNDTTTLQALTTNNASCEYLLNSTEWINDVTSNENAMTYIGNDDYCGDLLYAETNWKNSFIDSTYYSMVMNTTVPTMTSDTAPSGKSSVSSSYDSSGNYFAYKAFDGNDSSIWHAAVQSGNFWIQYEFPSAVEIVICRYHMDDGALGRYNTLVIQGSNDGSTWSDLIEPFKPLEPNAVVKFTKNIGKYKYYRWYIAGVQPYVHTIQYYGRN